MYVRKGELEDYARKLAPFINQISDYALFMLDPSGYVLSWNAGAERLLGYEARNIISSHFPSFIRLRTWRATTPGALWKLLLEKELIMRRG